jgi:hypothetical protein
MNGTLRLVAMVLIVVAAVALLAMCGEGVCTACAEALWHGTDRSGALRSAAVAVAAALCALAMPAAVRSFASRERIRLLPAPPLMRVASLRI